MLIYLDANIVQYCADHGDYLFGVSPHCDVSGNWLRRELAGLRSLIFLEQFGDWDFAVSEHLLKELYSGRPTVEQQETYAVLKDAAVQPPPRARDIWENALRLIFLGLSQADRWRLATALAMRASWFVTCDREIVRRVQEEYRGVIDSMHVALPSTAAEELRRGLFLV